MSDERESRESGGRLLVWLVAGPLVLLALLYLPLLLALGEHALLGGDEVYEFFVHIGLAEPLGRIYEPTIEFFRRLLGV